MNFINESDFIVYYSVKQNQIIDEKEAIIQSADFSSSAYYDFKFNGLYTLRQPGKYKYFQGLAAIPPKTIINTESTYYEIISNTPNYKISSSYNLDYLREYLELIKHEFLGKKIGVELSGGLDSSLVIEALLKLKIDPVLIGFSSDEFEFRTEREIQKYYHNKASNSILLKYEDHYAFSNLKETPVHPIPVSESHFFQRHKTVAVTARNFNVDILFSGEAGDQLLSSPLNLETNKKIPLEFGYWCLSEHWSNQYVYNKLGVQYISGMALGLIPSILLSLRNGQQFDPMKIWARKYFNYCLPHNLSNYAYTAFHNGWVAKGLINAANTIEEICELSYFQTRNDTLNPDKMKSMALKYGALDENKKKLFLINLAYSTWFYSLKNAN